MYYVNYLRFDDNGEQWYSSWHKGLKTERGVRNWLTRHGFEEVEDGHWLGSVWPYDCDAKVYTWESLPEHARKLFATR